MINNLFTKQFVFQLILFFLLFSLGTALAIGIPATVLINQQTENQTQALAYQTNQTTIALFENQISQLQNLAYLLSERPTLNEFLSEDIDQKGLNEYLAVFRQNSGVDGIFLCSGDTPVALGGDQASPEICSLSQPDGLVVAEGNTWLLSSLPGDRVSITVGQMVNRILEDFRIQTGMQYMLFQNDDLLSPGSIEGINADEVKSLSSLESDQLFELDINGQSHLASVIPLSEFSEQGFKLVGLLVTEEFSILNRQFRNIILITLLLVSLVGGLIAVLIARRISRPLNQLAESAIDLRGGDLSSSIAVRSKIWEIDQLSKAVEDARISLKHSLDQLRMERDWIENLLNAIIEGVVTIDEKNQVTFASQGLESILGVTFNNLIGYPVDQFFITPPGEEPFSRQIPKMNQKSKIAIRSKESEMLLSVSSSSFLPPEAGNATRALLIRDVTDEERIHRLMGEFMANITHEFRTPLAALSASVELLMDQLPDLSLPETRELLEALDIGVTNLQALIDNLIEAASIESGRFTVNTQQVEFNTILTDAVNTIKPIAEKHEISIITPRQKTSIPVNADRRRTCQVLVNLLSNAIKHSPAQGSITITASIVGKKLLVEVADEGHGVELDQQPYLFNRYTSTAKNENFSQLGLGLGLSVVKAIVEAQNGEVGFKNRQTGGALFWFTLPLTERSLE
ncbi:MAG: ATP-binding protein [Brevefilum sp.]|nr:ATP-binding protein [Brevefilum sp.]